MNILSEIERYKKVFYISIPISYQAKNQGQWLVFQGDRAVLFLDGNSLPVIPMFMAQVKMGILYHPLLATFYFQGNLSSQENRYSKMFYDLAEPLIDVWTVQTQSKYMGESAFAKELDNINIMNEALLSGKLNNVKTCELLSVYLFTKTFVNANLTYSPCLKAGDSGINGNCGRCPSYIAYSERRCPFSIKKMDFRELILPANP